MIKNETLKKILPSSILLNPIGKNGNEIWIEDFEQIYPLFFKSVLEIQKTDISEFSGFGEFTEDGKPEYSTFQAFLIKNFDDSNDDYWKNWKELFNTSIDDETSCKTIIASISELEDRINSLLK